jgi:hypothetical protein
MLARFHVGRVDGQTKKKSVTSGTSEFIARERILWFAEKVSMLVKWSPNSDAANWKMWYDTAHLEPNVPWLDTCSDLKFRGQIGASLQPSFIALSPVD